MPDKTIKRRPLELDRDLASHDGPIFATVAKLAEALKRCIPEGTENAERKRRRRCALAQEFLRGTKYKEE